MILKKIYFFLAIFSFLTFRSNAESGIDELLRKLDQSSVDTQRVNLMNEISYQYLNVDIDRARIFADSSLEISKRIKYMNGQAHAYSRLGIIAIKEDKLSEAESVLLEAKILRELLGNEEDIASANNNLAILYKRKGDYLNSIELWKENLDLLRDVKSKSVLAKTHNNLGNAYTYLTDYKQAVFHIEESISIKKEIADRKGLDYSYLNLASLYERLENWEMADSLFKKSFLGFKQSKDKNGQVKALINWGNFYSTLDLKQKSFEKYLQVKNNYGNLTPDLDATINSNLGVLYKEFGQYEQAIDLLQAASRTHTLADHLSEYVACQYNLGSVYKLTGDYEDAITHAKLSHAHVDKLANPVYKSKILDLLSELYALQGKNGLAYHFSKQYVALNDSLNSKFMSAHNFQLSLEKSKHESTVLKQEIAFQKEQNIQRNRVFSLLFLLITALLSALYYRSRKIIAENDAQFAYYEVDNLIKDQELRTSYARLEGQDEERKRIAQDLHDRVGSMLSTIKVYFSNLDMKIDEIKSENKVYHEKAIVLLDKACDEVRQISKNLISGTLKNFGLQAEVEALVEVINESNSIKVELFTHGLENRLPLDIEIEIYRITQELVSNALKHAKAKLLIIELNKFDDMINVIVQDNGIGFDVKNVKKKGGMGLNNVAARTHHHGGTIHMDSNTKGTTISIDIPFQTELLNNTL